MGAADPIRVLCVEDDPGLARLLQKRLERAGFLVDIALDGVNEFAKHPIWNYDVLAVDHNMPGKSGLELIRELSLSGNLPVTIMITGAGDEAVAVEALKLGAFDYVIKDTQSDYLENLPSLIDQALSKEKLRERRESEQNALKRSYEDLEKRVSLQQVTLTESSQKLQLEIENREKAEAAFRISDHRFRLLFEESLAALCLSDREHGIIDVNRSFRLLFGLDEDEIIGNTLEGFFIEDASYKEFIDQLETKGFVRDFEWRAKTWDSHIRDCVVTASILPGKDGEGVGFQHIIRDITARKETERAIHEARDRLEESVVTRTEELIRTNERLKREIWEKERIQVQLTRSNETIQALLDASNDQVALLDKDSKIILANETLLNMVNLSAHEIVGRDPFGIWSQEIASMKSDFINMVIRSAAPIKFQDEFQEAIYENTICPIKDSNNQVAALAIFIRDITDQVRREELQIQTARFKAVADLASGVAHNFNNLLQIILAGAQTAIFDIKRNQQSGVLRTLDQIVSSCKNGAEMVRRLQRIAGVRRDRDREQTEVFDVSEVIEEASEITQAWRLNRGDLTGVRINIEKNLAPNCLIRSVRSEMIEVFINLIKNAVESLPEGGLIKLASKKVEDTVQIEVSDNGTGISEENRRRLFTPFFTTKNSTGTGLGLATSKVIVEKHRGKITAESELGKGATIRITLPLLVGYSKEHSINESFDSVMKLNLLLIDDDIATLSVLQKGLSSRGFTVFTALSGAEGVHIFMNERIDIVVCDLGMPQMNGWETSKRIRAACSANRISRPKFVILTGWGGQADTNKEALEVGVDAVLEKPVTIDDLVMKLTELDTES